VVRFNAAKAFDIKIPKLTTNGATCAKISVSELRLKDSKGIKPDYVFDGNSRVQIARISENPNADTLTFTIDPTRCASTDCDFSQPIEF